MPLTDKKRRFADALLSGVSNRDAAVQAGYSEKTAFQAGSKLAKDPDVLAHVERLRKTEAPKPEVKPEPAKVNSNYEPKSPLDPFDPIAFLESLMGNEVEDPKLRLEAAKALLPYKHAKKGEVGKKDAAKDAAAQAAAGRFGVRQPPKNVVPIGRR